MKRRFITLFLAAAFVIPAYPHSEKKKEIERFNNGANVKTVYYTTKDSADKILDYYKEQLSNAGWDLAPINVPGVIVFYKGRETVSVFSKDIFNRGTTDIYVAHSLVSEVAAAEIQKALVQDYDMPGKDLPFVPRYPGAIRRSYAETPSKQTIVYQSKQGCFDCVLNFYRSEMVAKGWRLINEKKYDISPLLERKDAPKEVVERLSQLKENKIVALSFAAKMGKTMVTLMEGKDTVVINIVYNP